MPSYSAPEQEALLITVQSQHYEHQSTADSELTSPYHLESGDYRLEPKKIEKLGKCVIVRQRIAVRSLAEVSL